MKKVLIVFDGISFSIGAFEFAKHLNSVEKIMLTGVFIPQINYSSLWSYTGAMAGPAIMPLSATDEDSQVSDSIGRFEELCRQNDITFTVHKDYFDFALPELKKETRFADLLLLSGERFYQHSSSNQNNDHIKDALQAAECPVIVIPENFQIPSTIILAYDGSVSSVYAIKQFAYLFSQLEIKQTFLVFASKDEKEIPDERNIIELVSQHYQNMKVYKFHNHRKEFTSWLDEKKGAILVSGSFGRSAISLVFRESFVNDILSAHKIPVFIAHK